MALTAKWWSMDWDRSCRTFVTTALCATSTGERHTAFRVQTPAQRERVAEINRRGEAGISRMELLTPDLWAPLPGFITGVIVSPRGGPVYLTGLGNALVRMTR